VPIADSGGLARDQIASLTSLDMSHEERFCPRGSRRLVVLGHELDIHLADAPPSDVIPAGTDRRGTSIIALGSLFGLLYFVQGIVEPTDGLLSQPIKSLLRNWGYSAASTAWFIAVLSVAWAIKPLYGLLTDFVPLAGSRRRSYLLLTTAVATISLTVVYLLPLRPRGWSYYCSCCYPRQSRLRFRTLSLMR
jgi:hypothetical protein